MTTVERRSKAVIVGAGFAGLCTAITLKDQFQTDDFVIYERHEDIGGTWHANTYPGCASDVPAPWYSLSTDLKHDWSKFTPPHHEMKQYLRDVCDNHQLGSHLQTNSFVQSVHWDDTEQVWRCVVQQGGNTIEHVSKLMFMCQGALVYPNKMSTPGLETFKGEYWHTAGWNHEYDLTDKRVVVIGNGCSAAQVIPEIMGSTRSLTQIMRSKQWFYPSQATEGYKLYDKLRGSAWGLRFLRYLIFAISEAKAPLFNSENLLSGVVERSYTQTAKDYIKKTAPVEFHDLLIPEFKLGCKRTIFDQGYLESLHNGKMLLTMENITHVSENAVHTEEGSVYPADVIIYATGYNIKEGMTKIDIHGRTESLREKWDRDGVAAYETLMVDDCPNMYFLAGPNFATGHSSVVLALENAQLFIQQTAAPVISGEKEIVQVTPDAYKQWQSTISEALEKTVFSSPYGGVYHGMAVKTAKTTLPLTRGPNSRTGTGCNGPDGKISK